MVTSESDRTQLRRTTDRLVSIVALRWYERVKRTLHVRPAQRGLYRLGSAELTTGDVLGFDTRTEAAPGTAELVVYPRVVPLDQLGLPARRPLGD